MTTIVLAGLGTPLVTYGLIPATSPTPTPPPTQGPDPRQATALRLGPDPSRGSYVRT